MPAIRAATVLLLIALLPACSASETAPTELTPPTTSAVARAYLEEIIDLMESGSMRRDSIDWTAFRNDVYRHARTAQHIGDLQPAIRRALELLGDGHSHYRVSPSSRMPSIFVSTRSCLASSVQLDSPIPRTIGYVRVTGFSGTSEEADVFASSLQTSIRDQDSENVVGWIVDLRSNLGGNMWPMLSGIGPILGTDTVGYFINPSGGTFGWSYRADGAAMNGETVTHRSPVVYRLRRERPRVAVLTDQLTGSSGEAITIAFRERPNTRSFGASTCGLSTANMSIKLSDAATLVLAVAVMADRTRQVYGGPVVPDELRAPSGLIARAVEWLTSEAVP